MVFLALPLGLALFVVTVVIRGFVFSVLWGWFIAEAFSLPAIGIAHSIGLAMMFTFLSYQYDAKKKNDKDEKLSGSLTTLLVFSVVAPFFVLLCGWIIHGFMP
jgi:hypothetical protein